MIAKTARATGSRTAGIRTLKLLGMCVVIVILGEIWPWVGFKVRVRERDTPVETSPLDPPKIVREIL